MFFFSSQSSGATNYGLWSILNWFCLRWKIWIQFLLLLVRNLVLPELFFENAIFCAVYLFLTHCWRISWLGCMGLYLSPSFYSITPLASVPVVCHYDTTVWFEVRVCDASKMALSETDCFDYLGSFVFLLYFIFGFGLFSISLKGNTGIFMVTVLKP